MTPVSREIQELLNLSDEELLSRMGPEPGGSQSEKVQRILDVRHARSQADAAKALLQATEKQAAAGDGLVKTTVDLVAATKRLASATFALVVVTVLLVLFAAVQAGVVVWQGAVDREHKRLSVRPHVIVSFDTPDDEAGWTLTNPGLGPAEIRWFAVSVDGHQQPTWEDVAKALQLRTPVIWQQVFYPGELKAANEPPTKLVRFKKDSSVMAARNRVIVEACYCSLYGDCWRVRDVVGSRVPDSGCSVRPAVIFRGPQ